MSVALAHRVDGPEDARAVFLASSLGTTWEMWDALTDVLAPTFRVVRFDTRGHGRSPVTRGAYSVTDLAADVVALADTLRIREFGFVGLSLGGAIGQTLALVQPARVKAIVLACTVPTFGDPEQWTKRGELVRSSGMTAIADATRGRWFTDRFRTEHPDEVERFIDMLTGIDPIGYAGCCEALARFDSWSALDNIRVPVRVIAGAEDQVATPRACRAMSATIRGSDLVVLDGAAHIASAERPEAFGAACLDHLERHL